MASGSCEFSPKDPQVYSPGDIVFVHCATHSDASRERVGKLEYKFTGPWRILELLHGGSYSLEHCLHPKHTDKKHASDLMPYPPKLVPFKPVDGADTRYGQLITQLANTHSKKPVSKVLHPWPHFGSPISSWTLETSMTFVGQLYRS